MLYFMSYIQEHKGDSGINDTIDVALRFLQSV